jgi:hypothetical protein
VSRWIAAGDGHDRKNAAATIAAAAVRDRGPVAWSAAGARRKGRGAR